VKKWLILQKVEDSWWMERKQIFPEVCSGGNEVHDRKDHLGCSEPEKVSAVQELLHRLVQVIVVKVRSNKDWKERRAAEEGILFCPWSTDLWRVGGVFAQDDGDLNLLKDQREESTSQSGGVGSFVLYAEEPVKSLGHNFIFVVILNTVKSTIVKI